MTKPNLGSSASAIRIVSDAGSPRAGCRKSSRSATAPCGSAARRRRNCDWVDPILAATTTLQLATGIVNIWTADAGPVSESFHRIDKAYPGRFLLGIGVGHPEAGHEYTQADRRADRVPGQARRIRRAEGPPSGRRAGPAGAQAVGTPQRRCASRI